MKGCLEEVFMRGLLLLDWVPIPCAVRGVVSHQSPTGYNGAETHISKVGVDSYTGRRTRGGLVSGAVVADAYTIGGRGVVSSTAGVGEEWTPIPTVRRGMDCFPLS